MTNQISTLVRAQYDALPGLNFSTLKSGLVSMRQLKWDMANPKERTDDMLVGLAWHLAVFEPGDYAKRTFMFTGKKRMGEIWDICKAKAEESNGYALTEKQYATVSGMRASLRENAQVRAFLDSEGKGEQAIQWTDESGTQLKGQIDRLCSLDYGGVKQPWIIDGKTTSDISERALKQKIVSDGWHMQAALYLDGCNAIRECPRRFAWIIQEKDAAYDSCVYEPSEQMIDEGRKLYKKILAKFAECTKNNRWPGRQDKSADDAVEVMELPTWGVTE